MEDESPRIKTLIIEDAPKEKDLTLTSFLLDFISCKDSVGYRPRKVPECAVTERSGLIVTGTISHYIISHHRALITGNLGPKCLNIEVVMAGGRKATMTEF